MSLRYQPAGKIPEETMRVARAALPKPSIYMQMRDELGTVYEAQDFEKLFPQRGQPAEDPVLLALATIMQLAEGLSDRQAEEAVRARIDWKYALGLELTDPGFDHTVLSEFRSRLSAGEAEELLLNKLLSRLRELNLLKARGEQRSDSTHVLGAIRVLNRLERVGETLRAALNALAVAAPDWLREQAPAEWFDRYATRVENYRLPKTETARQELAAIIGADGERLLKAVEVATDLAWLRELPAVVMLRQMWAEQYTSENRSLRWRSVKEMPSSAEMIASPYDPEARWSTKRTVEWVGYKVHLTETCDQDAPRLITHVETTPATTPDDNMLTTIHEELAAKELLPQEHLVDKGYTDAEVLVTSQQEHQVRVIGPVAFDASWQARAGEGFGKGDFIVDWEAETVTCLAGKKSLSWLPNIDATKVGAIRVHFSRRDCTPCAFRSQCTKAKIEPRELMLLKRAEHEALQQRRRQQTTPEFKQQYAARAGIEGTHSQGVRRCGLRRSRYIGLAKTHLQHVLTAVALNIDQVRGWLMGTLLAQTRCSHFAALQRATG